MADEKPIKPLACDDPRRQRYAELLAQAGRMTVPRLHPGDANSVMSQLATMLGAPVPIVGAMTEHAAAWRACLLRYRAARTAATPSCAARIPGRCRKAP